MKSKLSNILIGKTKYASICIVFFTQTHALCQNYNAIGSCENIDLLYDVPFQLNAEGFLDLEPVIIDFNKSKTGKYVIDEIFTKELVNRYFKFNEEYPYTGESQLVYYQNNFYICENEMGCESKPTEQTDWSMIELEKVQNFVLPYQFSFDFLFNQLPEGSEIIYLNVYAADDYSYDKIYLYSIPWVNIQKYLDLNGELLVNSNRRERKPEDMALPNVLLNGFVDISYLKEVSFTFPGGVETALYDAQHPDVDFDSYSGPRDKYKNLNFDYAFNDKPHSVKIYIETDVWNEYNLSDFEALQGSIEFDLIGNVKSTKCKVEKTIPKVKYKKVDLTQELSQVFMIMSERFIKHKSASIFNNAFKEKLIKLVGNGELNIYNRYDWSIESNIEFNEKRMIEGDYPDYQNAQNGRGQLPEIVTHNNKNYKYLGDNPDEYDEQYKIEPGTNTDVWKEYVEYYDDELLEIRVIKSYAFSTSGQFLEENPIGIEIVIPAKSNRAGLPLVLAAISIRDLQNLKLLDDPALEILSNHPSRPLNGRMVSTIPLK